MPRLSLLSRVWSGLVYGKQLKRRQHTDIYRENARPRRSVSAVEPETVSLSSELGAPAVGAICRVRAGRSERRPVGRSGRTARGTGQIGVSCRHGRFAEALKTDTPKNVDGERARPLPRRSPSAYWKVRTALSAPGSSHWPRVSTRSTTSPTAAMIVIIGICVVMGAVLGGFSMSGGHIGALLHPSELLTSGGRRFARDADDVAAQRPQEPRVCHGHNH